MFAMIVLNLKTKKLNIVYDPPNQLALVKSEKEAELFVANFVPNSKLMGILPDLSEYIKVVLEGQDNGRTKKENSQGKRSTSSKKEQKKRTSVVKRAD